jgi:antitoxin component YwqK of YwqJK toxin-antitoxin module
MINANGYKHGTWIEFYDTGEIETKREYKNGQLIVGYCYDKQGKANFKLEKNSEMEIAEPIEKIK